MNLKHRPRRLRLNPSVRALAQEFHLRKDKLIYPLFVTLEKNIEDRHPQVPGIVTLSIKNLRKFIQPLYDSGLRSVLLFGISNKKDSDGSQALDRRGPVPEAIKILRNEFQDLTVGTDIALDPYTSHGHDGLFDGNEILNDETIEKLCEMSLLHSEMGAHMVAPSDMMDGRIKAIRKVLDTKSFKNILIMSYTAKYASCLYGPFRDTLKAKVKGDKKTYQMNPPNRRESLRELKLDLKEGADIVMVKPATWYLDIINEFKQRSSVPIASYQVSGECAMIELAAKNKLLDRNRAIEESVLCQLRAGADIVVTYFVPELLQMIKI